MHIFTCPKSNSVKLIKVKTHFPANEANRARHFDTPYEPIVSRAPHQCVRDIPINRTFDVHKSYI